MQNTKIIILEHLTQLLLMTLRLAMPPYTLRRTVQYKQAFRPTDLGRLVLFFLPINVEPSEGVV